MSIKVLLSITGRQAYEDQEPDVIELVTEGTMEFKAGGWNICYRESDLTGMQGVTSTFRVEPGKIVLSRTGKLQSRMVFEQGVTYDSLYEMEFGAMMMRITANRVLFDISPAGGFVDLVYTIEIENAAVGEIDYHLDIRPIL